MEQITLNAIRDNAEQTEHNFFSDDFALIMDSAYLGRQFITLNQPYQEQGGRLLRVLSGEATYNINMENYVLRPNMVIFVPDGSIVEIRGYSDDYRAQVMPILDMPAERTQHDILCLQLSQQDGSRIGHYFQLAWEIVHKPRYSLDTLRFLQMALLNDLKNIELTEPQQEQHALSRQEIVMKGFMKLVNEHAPQEHRIQFYAEQLFLTPNRLSTIVKEQSGQTAMYWINRAIILQAKVLLKHSDLKNFEIADRLNFPNPSFFNKFFKAQTGMTPKEYQES